MEAVSPGVAVVPVRTPTLPPATHTNTWVVGEGALTVVDPASPWEDEQERLFRALEARLDRGERVERLFLTHHHHDHVSGARALRDRLRDRGLQVRVAAHPATAERVALEVDELLLDGSTVTWGGLALAVLHTPGHAPGHLVLHDPAHGSVIAGDMVAGVGTIAIDPDEGDLQDYLDSLGRMRTLGAARLLPAHGPVLPHPEAVLSFYVAHRHQRSDQVRAALDAAGRATPLELAPWVYPELDPRMFPVAAAQILTHLKWLARHGLARPADGGRWARE